MTAQELHELVEPIREAMVKDGVWPKRGAESMYFDGSCWWWHRRSDLEPTWFGCALADSHNSLVVALLGWALKTKVVSGIYFIPESGEYHVSNIAGPTILHALVAAYRSERGI